MNALTKKDVHPLPRIDDILDLLVDNKFLSTLDMASRYRKIKVDADSQERKTPYIPPTRVV